MRFDSDSNTYKLEGEFRYDVELGEFLELADDEIVRVVKIRTQLEDDLVIQAVIFELTKRGYTVIPPASQNLQGT